MSTGLHHVEKFLSLLKRTKKTANGWEACCPAHPDEHASLSVAVGKDDRIVAKCHAGCTGDAIRQSLGLQWTDYFPLNHGRKEQKRIVCTYPYIDADGVLRYEVVRFEPKEFRQRRPDPQSQGGYIWDLKGVQMLLYRLPELLAADPGLPVYLVEGEKDVDNARTKLGLVATCNSGGAEKWEQSFNEHFRGRTVVIIADKDKPNSKGERPGAEHAYQIACALKTVAARVIKPIELPGGAVKDISDWISAGGTREQLDQIVAAQPEFDPDRDIPSRDKPAEPAPAAASPSPAPAVNVGAKLGERNQQGKLVLNPRQTLPTARAYVKDFHDHPEGRTILSYGGVCWKWRDNRYAELEDETIRKQLLEWLADAVRMIKAKDGSFEQAPFESNPDTVNSALKTIRMFTHISMDKAPPAWIDDRSDVTPAHSILVCKRRLIDLETLKDIQPTPRLFVTTALDFDYDENAPTPEKWLAFLDQVLPDKDEQLLLQMWFGYCLTADTRQQKALYIVGAPRSGKGTIARVLQRVVGPKNCAGPTVDSLTQQFGLQHLVGKTLAIVSDARFSGEKIGTVVERLLCIIGEDTLTIPRKFLVDLEMKLSTRLMFLSNELPRVSEVSGALARRFMFLKCPNTFYDQEDVYLFDKLCLELPGILNWAIEGWAILKANGRFIEPTTSREKQKEMLELASPVTQFVNDMCVLDKDRRAYLDDLYKEWRDWCEAEGKAQSPTKSVFSRDLKTAVPLITEHRDTVQSKFFKGIGLKSQLPYQNTAA